MATAQSQKLSREDFRKQKVIEEQRKAGTLPAEVDPETGRDINPHIPHYIAQAPWYLSIDHPTLKHQRFEDKKDSIDQWYARGAKQGPAATKYRKGACANCGAMTHKAVDCMERPRKVGAKWSGQDIQQDEVIGDVALGFEAKRDRWNGYDSTDHMRTIAEWELIEQRRKQLREESAKETLKSGIEKDEEGDSDKDEDIYADDVDMPGQKVDTKRRTTVRTLRIREDTAKYLHNLDINSAYYDPKTHAMRDDPTKDRGSDSVTTFAGDNFSRYSGDAPNLAKLQLFSWEAEERGKAVHIQSNPTQAELLHKEYLSKKNKLTDSSKDSILQKYGGEEHLQAPPKELLLAQSEAYVEYSQTGRVIKGQERAKLRSKYEEDVHPLNHTSVWGSYWKDFKWGYSCCHSFIRNSYCTGKAGIEAEQASNVLQQSGGDKPAQSEKKSLLDEYVQKAIKGDYSQRDNKPRGARLGEGDVQIDESRLKNALEEEKKRKHHNSSDALGDRGKKSKYNSLNDKEVTEEELEAYRMLQARSDDPMAQYKDEEDE
ncbi:Pre-mRNA splicing Prp18-interacting factor-domain-containing protein [Polychytrium aggregatum]|uniref:Pre-mRNA splicing Prp18-interacting factor-domain-containing protein n=1 Tax=Polychytrium aggregatum TaxID=110093 RepID=UPI0022FF0D46|nr:Pre-mRNA splicing Prp18-interacting factor-domain-containing protein [Polychytrium aggregatum]KAI9193260.1 Pre-mRNA splicing Prp18-interacting factor-domain-containing protein [Polychytrium aggregatum]